MKGVFNMEERFIEFMKNNGLSKNTYESYASDIKFFKQYYYDSYGEELQELIRGDVIQYLAILKRSSAPTTINRKISALKQYNLFLIDEKIQEGIVILDKDYIKVQKAPVKKQLPTVQEINKLKHFTCKDEKNAKRDYCFVVILIYGGVRASEIVTIRLIDIRLEDRIINIIGKGNKFRQIIINNIMYDAIVDYLKEREENNIHSPYLFVGQKTNSTGGKPLSRNFANRLLAKYNELCKIAKLYPHLIRSLFCVNALNAGYTIDQVANQARS